MVKVGQWFVIAAVSPVSTPRRTSTDGAVVDFAFFLYVASAFVDRARRGQNQPAGAYGFDASGDDVFEQRIFDHSLPVGLDHRFVRCLWLDDWVAVDGVGQLQQAIVTGHCLAAPAFVELMAVGLSLGVALPGDCDVPPEPGDGGEEFEPLAEALGFFFELEFAARAALVDHIGVEAVVGAVAIDHVFVGGAVELFDFAVFPRFLFVIIVVCEGQVLGVVFVQFVVRCANRWSLNRLSPRHLTNSNVGTCQ